MSMSLDELAKRVGARLEGDGSVQVTGCAPIEHAGPDEVTFLSNAKYSGFLKTTGAAAVIIDPKTPLPSRAAGLVADDPYYAFRNAAVALHGFRVHPKPADGPVSDRGYVHPEATVGSGTVVHPFAVVEAGATIGRDCVLYPGAYVGSGAKLGDECVLFPNVVVYDHCRLGNRVMLHSSTVIGQDGFGFATHAGAHHKIPQTGIVVIEDDVELGAGCAIERATVGETSIGRGTKMADLVNIGHGTRIGEHCLLVSLVGVSGSVDMGNYVVLGGQAGTVGHLKIGDGVQAAAQTGITSDIPPGARIGGYPAVELGRARRNMLVGSKLYDLARRVSQLERELKRMKASEATR
jgi:UDP-3-O-[3-hydroxymyristoyl] glucosamine N-acyltransferase